MLLKGPNETTNLMEPVKLCYFWHFDDFQYLAITENNHKPKGYCFIIGYKLYTVELQWLEHTWNHENIFETGVVRANEC